MWEIVFHCGDLLIQLAIAVAVVPAAVRVSQVLREYPPHRHINGKVEYSREWKPPMVERLEHGD